MKCYFCGAQMVEDRFHICIDGKTPKGEMQVAAPVVNRPKNFNKNQCHNCGARQAENWIECSECGTHR